MALKNRKVAGAVLAAVAVAGASGLFGFLSGAAPVIRMQRYSVSIKKPPASGPGGVSMSPAIPHQSVDYTGSPASPAFPNNLRAKIQLENTGVRVDAYWRRVGSSQWTYYGAQTSKLYSTGIIAQFNPFYLPSGHHEVKFTAAGYRDLIVPLFVPY